MPVKGSGASAKQESKNIKDSLGVVVDLNEWDMEVTRSGDKHVNVKISKENGLTYFGTVFGPAAKELKDGTFKGDALYFELRRSQYNGQWRDELVSQGK